MPTIEVQDQEPETQDTTIPTEEVAFEQSAVEPTKKGIPKLVILLLVLFLIGLAAGLTIVLKDRNHLKNEVTKLSQSQTNTADEAQQLNTEVRKLIELPPNEVPTVATVVDASKVKNQAFFANSQNGDKVLLYAASGKAILYRPSTKKIIEVAPINLSNTQTSGTTKK